MAGIVFFGIESGLGLALLYFLHHNNYEKNPKRQFRPIEFVYSTFSAFSKVLTL